jgi:glycosyltransferase involved in cell wall biosynthesis
LAAVSARIAIFTPISHWGGSEELWYRTALALREEGHAVDVLRPGSDEGDPESVALRRVGVRLFDLERDAPDRLFALATAAAPRRVAYDPMRRQSAAAARRLLARRPDLVLISQGENLSAAHIGRLCSRLRLPYALLSHKAAELDWPPDGSRDAIGEVFARARLVAFVSEHSRRLTEDQIGASLPGAVVVRNPVDVGADGPLPWPEAPDGELRLACVGRLELRDKAQDTLLRVLAADAWRARPLHVTFVGGGKHRVALESLVARAGLERVTFAGVVDDLEAVWRDHHAAVLPSRTEGIPIALLEAMRCGRPAIVTDVGGMAEAIEDGVTGFIASAPAEGPLADALERAWARREEWPALGRAAAERAAAFVDEDAGRTFAARLLAVL